MSAADLADLQATFCATLVDEWVTRGLRHAVVAPGSRSTPMALALANSRAVEVHVFHDERSAAFAALGVALATGVPAVLLCTSGTAATHFHAAVVEADLSGVPMVVLTADRPPELHGVGAPQTIDQQHLYGGVVREFVDPGVPDAAGRAAWRGIARRAWVLATDRRNPGPVHLNLPFREPLVGSVGALPEPDLEPAEPGDVPAFRLDAAATELLAAATRGLVVAGRGVVDPTSVAELSEALGWPVLADPRSGCRAQPNAVLAFDSLLRSRSFADAHQPDVVLHLGEPPASKVLTQWFESFDARHLHVHAQPRTIDPSGIVEVRVVATPDDACRAVLRDAGAPPAESGWCASWLAADAVAQRAFDAAMTGDLTEPGVARALTSGAVAAGSHLVVASSMPVRDVEWFGGTAIGVMVHSNRGANGIDGVLATAIGVAIGSHAPTVVLLGDVALCHDASSLTALASRGLDLAIVVLDNDGGGIFSFLPQAAMLAEESFELLFGTPHGTDLVGLAAAHGLRASTAGSATELADAVRRRGTSLVRVATERGANVSAHDALHAAATADPRVRGG